MAGEAYSDLAVAAMVAHLQSQLPTDLDTVESDKSLTAGTMTEPVAYLDYRAPHDNRSPLIQVYDDGITPINQQHIYESLITVVLSYTGDADLSAAETFVRAYQTAIIRAVRRDVTLGGLVISTRLASVDARRIEGDTSAIRHLVGFGYGVRYFERICPS